MEVFFIAMGLFVTDHCPRLQLNQHMLAAAIEESGAALDPQAFKADIVKRAQVATQVRALVTKRQTNCVQALAMFGPKGTEVQGIVTRK